MGQVQIHECLYQLSLSQQGQGFAPFACPTSEQFGAEVAWPGDWPEAQVSYPNFVRGPLLDDVRPFFGPREVLGTHH